MQVIVSSPIKIWLIEHDNKILFVLLYAGLSLVLTLSFGLFWLLVIVLLHFVLEIIRHSYGNSNWRNIILNSVWETKMDFGLVLLALLISVYLDALLGMAGLGAAARTGGQCASRGVRFLSYQRTIRAILLSLDEVAIGIKAICCRQKPLSSKNKAQPEKIKRQNMYELPGENEQTGLINKDFGAGLKTPWRGKWGFGDYFGVSLFTLSFLLIIVAPFIGDSYANWHDLFVNILKEFHPIAYLVEK